jgi:predicted AAA+ superfamily ATPase
MKPRYLGPVVKDDLATKMVFVGGPRQVGKTTLATHIAGAYERSTYLNWDDRKHRRRMLDGSWSPDVQLVILDEVHKYTKWKSLVKGFWDTRSKGLQILVTGSSRLDTYRRSGDSLMGRYHYHRLHPFSLRELGDVVTPQKDLERRPEVRIPSRAADGLGDLMTFGGFPEPFLAASGRALRRWQQQRVERVFREDVRETENVRELSQVEILGTLLSERVGAPLSYASLARDLDASPKSVHAWIELLCRNYYVYRVPPYSRRLHRALKKESKYYLWDWSEVTDAGARFENLVGSHLLKYCHYLHDVYGHAVELNFVRDLEKREVDFLLTWHKKPWLLVECKSSPGASLTSLNYFADRLDVEARYVVTLDSDVDHFDRRTRVRSISADRFLAALV